MHCSSALGRIAAAALVVGMGGCRGQKEAGPVERPPPPPAEVFSWGGQPISFSPPPESWRREKEQSGGLRGARFVLSGSMGERIHVAEHYQLDDRDHCVRLAALASDFEDMDDQTFRNDLLRARPYAPEPINWSEAQYASEANESLDSAFQARMQKDSTNVRYWLDRAREEVLRVRYTLEEVVDRVVFTTEGFPSEPTFEVGEIEATSVGGEPAYVLDYGMFHRGQDYVGREYYVLKNNRLFVASFQGLEGNLELFEDIVDSISFPPGDCNHEG